MKNRLFYAEFGDADAAPAAAAEENSRKKVSDAFRVSFDNSQKKFFGLVRDGIFALLALVLFALSFAPVYGIRSSAYSPEYTTVDIIGMMFDLTADWDDEKYYEEYRDASEEFSEKYDEARKAGNYAEMRRLADRWRIEETRLLLRLERTDIPIGTFVVGGLIGLFFIVFAFLLAAVYVTAFVRTLLGKERIPAFLASRKLFTACKGCHGALFPAYLFYMVLFLLAVLQFGTITTYFVAGSMAAALAFASLGTLIFLADAFASSDRAAKKRIWSGITVFALSLTAVGVMFTPALTMRINDYRGTASSTLLRNLDFSDEDWAVLEESVLSLTYEEKQAYAENLLRESRLYSPEETADTIAQLLIIYDYDHMSGGLAAGYYFFLFAAAALGAAGAAALAGGVSGNATLTKSRTAFLVTGLVSLLVFLGCCAAVAGICNGTTDHLSPLYEQVKSGYPSTITDGDEIKATVGVGACAIAPFLIALCGGILGKCLLSERKKKDDAVREESDTPVVKDDADEAPAGFVDIRECAAEVD